MKTYAIAIRDVVANLYTQPVFTNSIGGAVREFGDRCKGDKKDIVAMHPEHFELWVIGEYDDTNGSLISYHSDSITDNPRQIAVGANYTS